jgi:hypothetical protein
MVEFLKTQFLRPEDSLDVAENWPRFTLSPSGDFTRVAPAAGDAEPQPVPRAAASAD